MNRKYSSSQLREKKKKEKIIKRWLVGITVILFIALLSYISHLPKISVDSIHISDNTFVNDSQLIQDINSILDGKYLWLFSKRNIILIPRGEIKERVRENIAIKDVSVKWKGLKEISIDVIEYEGVVKWCGASYAKPSQCYLVNSLGMIFAQDILVDIPVIYGIFENEEDVLGKNILSIDKYANLVSFIENVKQLNIFVDYIDTEDGETFAVHTTDSPYILITTDISGGDLINNLKTVIETEEINEAQFGNLEYIDLRFGNRVFYQIK